MNNLLEMYKTYINPIVIGIFVVMIVVTLFFVVKLLLTMNNLVHKVDDCMLVYGDIDQQLNIAKSKQAIVKSYYSKKKAQLNFLISCLFFLHVLNHNDN